MGTLADKEESFAEDGQEFKGKSFKYGKELHADSQRKGWLVCIISAVALPMPNVSLMLCPTGMLYHGTVFF